MTETIEYDFDIKKLSKELTRDEGVRFTPYKDSLGNLTIGVGHLLDPNDKPPVVWPKDVIYAVLQKDIDIAYNRIKNEQFYKELDTDNRKRAVLNMSFNLGNRLFEFKQFLVYLSKGQFSLASNDLNGTAWHRQTGERSNRIIGMLRNG